MNRTAIRSAPALLLLASFLLGAEAQAEPFESAAVLDDAQLAETRGGFAWQGMQISLGADLRTYINGELALQSTVSWTPDGASRTDAVFGALTPAGADQLVAGILTSGAITMNVGGAQVYLANEGQTSLIHRTDGGLQNILVNTASNVDLRQQVDATLDLQGYEGFAQLNMAHRLGTSLGDAVAQAALGSLSH